MKFEPGREQTAKVSLGNMENVLAKKLSTASFGRSPISDIEKLGNLLVSLVEKRLGRHLGAATSGMILDAEVTRLSTVAERVPVPAMLGILDFAGTENSTLVNISADLVFHIVDLLMGGDPEVCPMPTTRSFTSIDCNLLEDVLKIIGDGLTEALTVTLGGPLPSPFELTDVQQNITNVTIAPDNADILNFCASLDIGSAARGGDFELSIPLSVLDVVRSSVQKQPKNSGLSTNDIWRARMRRAASEADIPLTAILHRGKYKAEFLEKLEVGQVLEIASDAPQNVKLVIRSAGGPEDTEIAETKLGVFEGKKVVKLTAPPNPGFISYLIRATEDI